MQLWFMSHAVEPLSPTLFVKVVCLLNGVSFIDVFPSRVPKYVIQPCFKFSPPTRAVYYDRQADRLWRYRWWGGGYCPSMKGYSKLMSLYIKNGFATTHLHTEAHTAVALRPTSHLAQTISQL